MKKLALFTMVAAFLVTFTATGQKLVSSKSNIKFFSTTPAEDIEANNTTAVSTINTETGEVVFSVPMQGFEFEKSLMQKHYNSDKYLDTKSFPKAKLTGKMSNIDEVDFSKDGTYETNIEGELTIKGVTKQINEKGTIVVNNGKVKAKSKFNVTLGDYGISFVKGKPSTNIAKKVEVTVQAEYEGE
jgi:polyisoprenoid-binding protein YceI